MNDSFKARDYLANLYASRPHDADGRPLCDGCRKPVDAEQFSCASCTTKRDQEDRLRILNDEIASGLERARANIPNEAWARVGNPLFKERVRSPKLRAFAKTCLPHQSALLLGKSGVGKTTGVIGAAEKLIELGINAARAAGTTRCPAFRTACSIRWVDAPELLRKQRGYPLGRGDCPELDEAISAGILVLDDLGSEQGDPLWLHGLMLARVRSHRTTITTSGFKRSDLEARYGAGAYRRLFEPGGLVVDVHGDI